jgi:hypothetical protein
MASPMRMRGGSAVETGRASIAAAVEGDDPVAADAADFACCADGDDAAAGAEDFGARADGRDDLAVCADDFAARAEEGDASMVVESPMASASASLIAAGDASFERLRLLERVLLVRAADFVAASPAMAGDAAGADAFRFFGMGLCVVAAARRLEIAAGARCC